MPVRARSRVDEGSLSPFVRNGFGNGLNAPHLLFTSEERGKLHLAGNSEETADVTGEAKISGQSVLELVQVE